MAYIHPASYRTSFRESSVYTGKPASYAPAVDPLIGEALAGTVALEPYQVLVLKR